MDCVSKLERLVLEGLTDIVLSDFHSVDADLT